ncbi:MAG: S8 family serine peptidase [Bdellovibrionota bacterium]
MVSKVSKFVSLSIYFSLILDIQAQELPNDSLVQMQWHLQKIGAFTAWESQKDCDVKIAVLDTGIDHQHLDLKNNLSEDHYDFVNKNEIAQDDHGHGTFVAGLIGAEANNAKGVAGICWRAQISSFKVLNRNGAGFTSDAAQAIIAAANSGHEILNASFGHSPINGQIYNQSTLQALQYAESRGVLFVNAAGNSNLDLNRLNTRKMIVTYARRGRRLVRQVRYVDSQPIIPSNVILVGATTKEDQRSSFSNYGNKIVPIAAPGSQMISTTLGGGYGSSQGTSFSAPLVSGSLALIWTKHPEYNFTQTKNALYQIAENPEVKTIKHQTSRTFVGWAKRGRRWVAVYKTTTKEIEVSSKPLQGFFIGGKRLDLKGL